jgi:hypothetical protein
MPREVMSLRLDPELKAALADAARREGVTVTELIERYVREGLAVARHPGVVFKPGPSGRRAALAGGPDVWEIVWALRHAKGTEKRKLAAVAADLALPERQVVIAMDYAAANPTEIEQRIAANESALDDAERAAAARQRLLA